MGGPRAKNLNPPLQSLTDASSPTPESHGRVNAPAFGLPYGNDTTETGCHEQFSRTLSFHAPPLSCRSRRFGRLSCVRSFNHSGASGSAVAFESNHDGR